MKHTYAVKLTPENEALLKFEEVRRRVGFERTMLYGLIRKGEFPAPLRLSHRCSRWQASKVQQWIEEQVEKAEQLRQARERLDTEHAADRQSQSARTVSAAARALLSEAVQ